jgi:choline dehydrogenase-like flavoprotein
MSAHIFLLNGQLKGKVTLTSKDPADPPIWNHNSFSHLFNRRVAIEAPRETMRLVQFPTSLMDTTGVVKLRKSDSDEDILAYWREQACSTWQITRTVKMGKPGEEDACAYNDLRVPGLHLYGLQT